MQTQIEVNPVDKAAKVLGSQRSLAKILDVSPAAICKWRKTRIPAERVLDIEQATGVSRHELRPDIYPESTAA